MSAFGDEVSTARGSGWVRAQPSTMQLFHPASPITRPPMLMHYRGDEYSIRLYLVENRERKAGHKSLADVCPVDRAGFRELSDALSCFFDC